MGPSVHPEGAYYSFWTAAPRGTKSCRTQGTFVHPFVCSFVHSFIRLFVRLFVQLFVCSFVLLSPPPGPLRPEICPLRPKICLLRPEICLLRPWICPFRQTYGRTNISKFPPVFCRTSALWGPLPKKGQRTCKEFLIPRSRVLYRKMKN